MPQVSAGLLLYRRTPSLEVFLAHPGGPFWAKKDEGAWTIPKGLADEGEDLLAAAQREFYEETGVTATEPYWGLGSIKQKGGKIIHAWAWEGNADPATIRSNMMRLKLPNSSKLVMSPEVDRCEWFDPDTARRKINAAQAEFIARLEGLLQQSADES